MNKFLAIVALAALAAGEAPAHVGLGGYSSGGSGGGSSGGSGINEYVDEALLARVGQLISSGGDGSGTPQGTEGLNLDQEILSRVSGSIGDGGSSSGPSDSYGPPSRSGPSTLGNLEPAMRIAEFDLTDSAPAQGGYNAPAPAVAAAPSFSGGYDAPAPSRSSSGGPITLGRPMVAQRVADFSLSGGAGPSRSSGGYN